MVLARGFFHDRSVPLDDRSGLLVFRRDVSRLRLSARAVGDHGPPGFAIFVRIFNDGHGLSVDVGCRDGLRNRNRDRLRFRSAIGSARFAFYFFGGCRERSGECDDGTDDRAVDDRERAEGRGEFLRDHLAVFEDVVALRVLLGDFELVGAPVAANDEGRAEGADAGDGGIHVA